MRSRVGWVDDIGDDQFASVVSLVAVGLAVLLERQVVLVGCIRAPLGDLQVCQLEFSVRRRTSNVRQVESDDTLGAVVAGLVQILVVGVERQL